MAITKELTIKEEKARNRTKKIETLKRNWTLLKAKILHKEISPDDSRTLQLHKDAQGELRDYYISNPYLQEGISYTSVSKMLEDSQNNRFVYKGIVQGADNAMGIIEANVPLSEIVASADGNMKLQEMLSQENATISRNQYYDKIGENHEPIENHTTHFANPNFILGKILKEKNGKFTVMREISSDIEKGLKEEREKAKLEKRHREKDAIEISIDEETVVARQDCWMNQNKGIQFEGINQEAQFYQFMPDNHSQTEDKKYDVYIGKAIIGRKQKEQLTADRIQLITPFEYRDVVIWTEGKNLIQYFIEKQFNQVEKVLGNIFTNNTIRKAINQEDNPIFAGGITTNENRKSKKAENIPDSVKKTVEEYKSQQAQKAGNNIINFSDIQR